MRAPAILLTAILIIPAYAAAVPQDAEITFYSNGSVLSASTPHANHAEFIGVLFDNNQRIGLVQPRHFLTLHLAPGPHVFSASYSKHAAKNSQLALELTEGGRNFVRVQAEYRGIFLIETDKGRLDLVDCKTALQEAAKETPTDLKRIQAGLRDKIVSGTLQPCQ